MSKNSFYRHSRLLLILLLWEAHVCSGQTLESDRLPPKPFVSRLEFAFGLSSVWLHKNAFISNNQEFKAGYVVSASLMHALSPRFSLVFGLQYENKGYRFTYNSFNTDSVPPAPTTYRQKVRLNYATLSIMPKVLLGRSKNIHVSAGLYYGYLLGWNFSQAYYTDGVLVDMYATRSDPYYDNKKNDFGSIVSAGYSLKIKDRRSIFVQLRYSRGLVDMNQQPTTRPARNDAFSILLGIAVDK